MSGIVGIVYFDGRPVESADLERMAASLAHRGPDGQGIWRKGSIGLGHRMLWTTPESLDEKLPFTDSTRELTITADARIDNRDELISILALRNSGGISDGELILAAYAKWGEHCPEKLLGDFAFAIWDGRRQALFCARDHFGVKPFYYYRSANTFALATEIKGLLCFPDLPRRLNEARLADYLVLMMEDKVATLYEGIYRLPPGHSLIADRERTTVRCYWELDPTREIRFRSDTEYAEAFRDMFAEAVRCRLRSAGAIGSTLSGGLDSSSIACIARKLLRERGDERLHTFSGIYDDVPACDERPYIHAVLAQGGVEPHFGHPDRLSPLSDWEGTSWQEDEPLWNPQIALHWVLYQAAQEQHVHVLLDGVGGDSVVSHGVLYLTELARAGRWLTFALEAGAFAKHFQYPFRRVVRQSIVPLAPELLRQAWRRLHHRNNSVRTFDNIPIRSDFAECINLVERLTRLDSTSDKPVRTARRQHWLEITSGLEAFSLEVIDRTAGLFQIEPRYPFFDRRLAEFCLALPSEQKMHRGWTRMIMRRALVNVLPDEIRWRSGKTSLGPSFEHLLFTTDRAILEDVIVNDPGDITEFVNITALRQLYHRYRHHPNGNDGFMLWRVVVVALWLRRTGLMAKGGGSVQCNFLE